VPLNENSVLKLRAGKTKMFRVLLSSPESGPHPLIMEVPVPRRTAGMFGSLEFFGGNSGFFSEEEFFEGDGLGSEEGQPTFDEILSSLKKEPHNDDVVANLSFYDDEGQIAKQRQRRASAGLVVDGGVAVGVRVR
jgi:hypothetical protein